MSFDISLINIWRIILLLLSNFLINLINYYFQFSHPNSSDWQWDSVDEHPLQGEVPRCHSEDGGETQQLHHRSREVNEYFGHWIFLQKDKKYIFEVKNSCVEGEILSLLVISSNHFLYLMSVWPFNSIWLIFWGGLVLLNFYILYLHLD